MVSPTITMSCSRWRADSICMPSPREWTGLRLPEPVRVRGDTPKGIIPPSRYGKTATPLAAVAPAPVVPEGIDGAADTEAEEMTQH